MAVSRRPSLIPCLAALAMMVVVAGCSHDGRALADPQPWQTTTTRPSPPTSAPDSQAAKSGLALTSPDFTPGGTAPAESTCAGRNVFPRLQWVNLPANTVEVAVALSDQTDPKQPLLLWLMAGITPLEGGLQAGTAPAGAFETLNDYGNPGYGSPCLEDLPDGKRDLQFRVYALSQPSGLAAGSPGNEAWDQVEARSIDSASVLMRIDSAAT